MLENSVRDLIKRMRTSANAKNPRYADFMACIKVIRELESVATEEEHFELETAIDDCAKKLRKEFDRDVLAAYRHIEKLPRRTRAIRFVPAAASGHGHATVQYLTPSRRLRSSRLCGND